MEKMHCSLCGGKMAPLTGTTGRIETVPICPNCDMYPGMGEELTKNERMRAQAKASEKVTEWQERRR